MSDAPIGNSAQWVDGHPSEETLLRVAEDAVAMGGAAEVTAHVQACWRCASIARDIGDSRTLLRSALRRLDDAEPASWREPKPVPGRGTTMPAARTRLRAELPGRTAMHRRHSPMLRVAVRFAAATTLIAGVAYGAVHWRARAAFVRPAVTPPSHALPDASRNSLMQPAPSADFQVRIDSADAGSHVVIVVATTGDAVGVEVRGAHNPHFQSARDAMIIALQRDLATIVVTVPPGVTTLRVVANGREVARVQDGRVTPATARAPGIDVRWY